VHIEAPMIREPARCVSCRQQFQLPVCGIQLSGQKLLTNTLLLE